MNLSFAPYGVVGTRRGQATRRWTMGAGVWLVALVVFGLAPMTFAQDGVRVAVILPSADTDPLAAAVAESARMGAVLAAEELGFNAQMFGVPFEVTLTEADGADAVTQAAEEAIVTGGAQVLVGGFGEADALAAQAVAARHQVPFLNAGSSADSLRNEACEATSFHVVPSAAMYLDALAGWFVRSGMRDWLFVMPQGNDGDALFQRAKWTIEERHFGARVAGKVVVAEGDAASDDTIAAVARARHDLVVLLLRPHDQLAFLASYEAAGLDAPVTMFPYTETQSRAFGAAALAAAPSAGAGFRPVAWEASLDAYGARELNARFLQRWQAPMEPFAWATYQAVKMTYDAATFGSARSSADILAYLTGEQTVFDVWKGIGVTFRAWDRQLRQPLYLVQVVEDDGTAYGGAVLVGELPAIYMPGTDPVERLDQIGDLAKRSRCTP